MTPDKARALLPIIQAYADGKTIQLYSQSVSNRWIDISSAGVSFTCDVRDYRIKPQPTTRPWTRAEFPMTAPVWIRSYEGCGMACLVTRVENDGVYIATTGFYAWDQLAKDFQHSIDGKTWHPCTVVVNE